MYGEWIRLCAHFFQSGLGLLNRFAQVFEGVLKPVRSHHVHANINAGKNQGQAALGRTWLLVAPLDQLVEFVNTGARRGYPIRLSGYALPR